MNVFLPSFAKEDMMMPMSDDDMMKKLATQAHTNQMMMSQMMRGEVPMTEEMKMDMLSRMEENMRGLEAVGCHE